MYLNVLTLLLFFLFLPSGYDKDFRVNQLSAFWFSGARVFSIGVGKPCAAVCLMCILDALRCDDLGQEGLAMDSKKNKKRTPEKVENDKRLSVGDFFFFKEM